MAGPGASAALAAAAVQQQLELAALRRGPPPDLLPPGTATTKIRVPEAMSKVLLQYEIKARIVGESGLVDLDAERMEGGLDQLCLVGSEKSRNTATQILKRLSFHCQWGASATG